MANDVQIRITADASGVESAARRAGQSIAGMESSLAGTQRASEALTASFARMGHAAVAGLGAGQVIQAADAWANLNARLSLVSDGSAAAALAYARVLTIAQSTRMGLEEVGSIYEKFARQSETLGLSATRIAGLTTTVAQAMSVSGASTQAAQAALLQFGQALSSGVLRGEELNSVLEQGPRLAQALADGLGVPVGKLRELGEAGELTGDKLVRALEGQAGRISAEFARMPVTVAGALTNIRTAWTDTVGSFEQSTGVFRGVAGGLQVVADHMGAVATAGGVLAAVMAGRVAGSLAAAVAGKVAATQAASRLAAAELAEATAAQVAATAQIRAAGAYGAGKVAIEALAQANTRLAAAQSAAAATGPLAVGLRALGGPIGLVTTVLTLGAAAWSLWGDSAKAAADQAREALRAAEEEAHRSGRDVIEVLRERERAAKVAYDASPRDADGMRDITGSAGKAWTLSQQQVMDEEARLKNIAERSARMASSVSEKWSELYATQAEKRAQAITKLDASYVREVAAAAGNQERILQLTRDYQSKLGVINEQFTKKGASDAAQVARQQFENRFEAIKGGLAREEAEIKRAHELGEINERAYWERLNAVQQESFVARAAALKEQLQSTTDPKQREAVLGDIQKLGGEAAKAAEAYRLALGKMKKAEDDFWEQGRQEHARAAAEEAESLLQKAKAAEDENAKIGLTTEQLQELIRKRYDEQIALKRARVEELRGIADRDGEVKSIEQQIEALERLKNAEVTRPGLEAQAQAWHEFSRDIEQSLTDALMRSFESGESFGEAFVNSLRNTLKTAALKVVVQAIVNPIMGGVGQVFGMPVNGGNSAAGGLNNLTNVFSATGYGAAPGSVFYANAVGAGGGDTLGAFIDANQQNWAVTGSDGLGGAAGGVVGSLGGAFTAYGLGQQYGAVGGFAGAAGSTALAGGIGGVMSGAGFSAGAMSALAAIPVWGWIAMGAAAILGSLAEGGGPKTEGGAERSIDAGGALTDFSTGNMYGDHRANNLGYSANAVMNDLVGNTLTGVRTLIEDLGGSANGLRLGMQFNTDPLGDAPDMVASSVYDATGNRVFSHANNDVARGQYQHELANEVKRVTIAAVDAADINPIFEAITHGIDEAKASAQELDAAIAKLMVADQAIDLAKLMGLDEASRNALLSNAKDLPSLAGQMAEYYQNFYSEEKRRGAFLDQMRGQFSDLGFDLPLTRDAFVALVDSLDLTTESGQQTYAALLALSPAMATVADSAAKAAQEWAGFDAAGLGKMILDSAFNPQAGMTAAEAFSQSLEASVRQALIGSTVGSVATMIFDSIVVPMVAGSVVSQAAIDGVVTKAREALTALGLVLQELDLSQITDAVGKILPQVATYAPPPSVTAAVASSYGTLVGVAENPLASLTSTMNELAAGIAEANAATQALVTGGMTDYARQVGELQKQAELYRVSLAGGIGALQDRRAEIAQDLAMAERFDPLGFLAAAYRRQLAGLDDQLAAASTAADRWLDAQMELLDARQFDALKQEWQGVADAMISTMRRLRGDILGDDRNFAATQAEFALATAAARAGDQSAAQRVPELAMAVVDLGKVVSVTAADQALLTARTLASLRTTVDSLGVQYGVDIPAFATGGLHAGGLRWVGEQGPELEATGPARIYNLAQMREVLQGGNLAAEVRALREEVRRLREENAAQNGGIALHTAKTASILARFDDGDAMLTRVVA